jgi:hypothetical protein
MRKRLVMGILAAVAVGGIVFVFSSDNENIPERPAAVEAVSPQGGEHNLRQVTVSADLAPGYTGYLTWDGVEVAADDLQIVDALNSITLSPQPDSDYRTLQPGPHCAGVVYWLLGQNRDTASTYTWCFNLH